jgi:CRP-like cAMP-binding protein
MMVPMDGKELDQCVLFKGLRGKELDYALHFFHAQERTCRRGEQLHRAGDPLPQFGLVLEGIIHVSMDDFDGNQLLMATVTPGITFGEALCWLGTDTQVSMESVTDARVLMMDTDSMRTPPEQPLDTELTRRFMSMLAGRLLRLNDRIQVLSKLTIREKVITLLSQYAAKDGTTIVLPFSREAMAVYLGTNQSALSRELSRMQEEGIIRFQGNRFEIL